MAEELVHVNVKEGVCEVYPDFAIDGARLAAFVQDPGGPIGLTPKETAATVITVDAKARYMVAGSASPEDPISRFQNSRDKLPLNTTRVKLGVRSVFDVRSIQDIESSLVHELVHVRQLKHREGKARFGHALVNLGLFGGMVGVPAAMEAIFHSGSPNPVRVALNGLMGAISGWGTAYWFAPHEREARRVAKSTPYSGLITGTRNPDLPETWMEKQNRRTEEIKARSLAERKEMRETLSRRAAERKSRS